MTFEEYREAMAKTPLTEAEKKTISDFRDAMRSVELKLIRAKKDKVSSAFGKYVASIGFVITEPGRINSKEGQNAWQLDTDRLEGLHDFLLEGDNFQDIMQAGTSGEEPAFGADGKLIFEVLGTLQKIGITIDAGEWKKHYDDMQKGLDWKKDAVRHAKPAQEEQQKQQQKKQGEPENEVHAPAGQEQAQGQPLTGYAAEYKKIAEEYLKLKNKPEPDAGEQPKEYVEHSDALQTMQGKLSHAQHVLRDMGMPVAQIRQAMEKAYGKEETDQRLERFENSLDFVDFLMTYGQDHPEFLNGLSDAEKEVFTTGRDKKTIEISKRLVQEGKFPAEDYERVLSCTILHRLLGTASEELVNQPLVNALSDSLTPEQEKEANQALGTWRDPLKYPPEEQVTYPRADQVKQLRNTIPEKITREPEKLKQYQEALDFAEKHLTRVKDEVKAATFNHGNNVGQVEARYTNHISRTKTPLYQNGKYHEMFLEKGDESNKTSVVKPEKQQAHQELFQDKIHLSELTKSGLQQMITKMEKMKLLEYGYDPKGEEANKIYGLNKLLKHKHDLEDALDSGDPDQIIAAKAQYEQTWKDTEELYDIAKKCFSQDPNLYPGNLDGSRNSALPWRFTGDIMTNSQVNFVFVLYMRLKEEGRTLEDYLENPTKGTVENALKQVEPLTLAEVSKGLKLNDCLDLWLGKGKYKNAQNHLMLASPIYGISRSLMGPSLLERDSEVRDGNIVYSEALYDSLQKSIQTELTKIFYLQHKAGNEAESRERQQTLENLILVADEDRNLNALMGGMPETDVAGRVIHPVFDAGKYVAEHPVDYEALLNRADILLNKAAADADQYLKVEEVLEAEQSAFARILAAHRADRGTPGYDRLEQAYLGIPERILEGGDPERIKRMQQARDEYVRQLPRIAPEAGIRLLSQKVANAQENVHGGSRAYDRAQTAIDRMQPLLRELEELKKRELGLKPEESAQDRQQMETLYERERVLIDEIRAQMRAAQSAIGDYFARKQRQGMYAEGKVTTDADPKSEKRIHAMADLRTGLDGLHAWLEETMPVPTAEPVQRLGMSDEELVDFIELHHIFNPQDAKWYQEETDRIKAETGYRINMRASGDNAFRLYLISQGATLEELMTLEQMSPADYKAKLQEFFTYIDGPKDAEKPRTREEKIAVIAKMHKKALEQMNAWKVPLPEDMHTVEGMAKAQKVMYLIRRIQIDLTQDAEAYTAQKADPGMRKAYFDALGDVTQFEENMSHLATLTQGYYALPDAIFKKDYGLVERAFAMDVARERLAELRGKTIAEVPTWSMAEMADLEAFIGTKIIEPMFLGQITRTNGELQSCLDYLEGRRPDYIGQRELREKWLKRTLGQRETMNSKAEQSAIELDGTSMEQYAAHLPDPHAGNLLTALSEEDQKALEQAWQKHFGQLYRGTTLTTMVDFWGDAFDLTTVPDGRSIREVVEKQYADLTPEQKERALRLETMRYAMTDGVKCSYARINRNGTVSLAEDHTVKPVADRMGLWFNNEFYVASPRMAEDYLKTPQAEDVKKLADIGETLQSSMEGYAAPMKERLADNGLDLMDCIFIGERTLNELYEERYRDLAPDMDKERLMYGVLAAESFHADTPIFFNYMTEDGEELINHPVPLTFHGCSFRYPENMPGREKNLAQTKAYAETVLAGREEKLADPETEREELLERAMISMESAEARAHAFGTEYQQRIRALKTRAQLFAPAYRILLQQTLEKIQTTEMDQALFQYRLYDRASRMALNPELKAEYAQKAQELLHTAPLADYEKYLTGLEHAYLIRPVEQTPAEIHAFFEEKTGECVPRFMKTVMERSVYRPTELTVEKGREEESIRALVEEVYGAGLFSPQNMADRNELILLGGRTLKNIMQELDPEGYTPNADGSEVIAGLMKRGWPVDFFIACDKPQRSEISSVPIHILPEGKHEANLDPELLKAHQAHYFRVLGSSVLSKKEADKIDETMPERKVRRQSEQELKERERALTERAGKDYENFLATDAYLTLLHGPGAFMSAFKKRFLPEGDPERNSNALEARKDLSEAEKKQWKNGLRQGRTTATSYIISRLAWESQEREKQGLPGYTFEQIISLNELAEQKFKYAQEFKEICANYDTGTYCENLLSGTRALMEMHAKRYPAEEIFASEEKMREAFLGKASGGIVYTIFDNKQELEKSVALQVSKGLFATEAQADEYIHQLTDLGSVGMMMVAKNAFERSVAAGEVDIRDGISQPYAHEVMLDRIRERLAQGLDPYEGMESFYMLFGTGGPLEDAEILDRIPALSNALHKRTADSREKLEKGTFFDTYLIDLDRLYELQGSDAGPEEFQACLREVTPEEKAKLKEQRLDEIEKKALDHRMSLTRTARMELLADAETGTVREIGDLEELSDEELNKASALYHEIFDPIMERPAVKEYLKLHPERNVYDLFRVGTIPLKDYLGGDVDAFLSYQDGEKALQEVILILASDPKIPFSYVTVRPDPATGAYVETGLERITDPADRSRIVKERPELASLKTYENWYKRSNPTLSTGRYTQEDWLELYESEFLKTADTGLISPDRVISKEELLARGDQVHFQSGIFARVESLYGAKPLYVPEYVCRADGSPEEHVYSRDEYKKYMKDLDAGSFTNGEYATLAYFTALNPAVVDDPVQSAHLSEEAVPHDMKVRAGNHFWTVDFNQPGQPRANLGSSAFAGKIAPARELTENLIAQYDRNNVQPMADMIAYGIRDLCMQAKTQISYPDTKCTAAHIGAMLTNMAALMEEREELQDAVKAQLTEDELELLNVMLRMYEMAQRKEEALVKLTAAENGTPLTDRERERCIAQIAAFDHYAEMWSDNRKAYEGSQVYQDFVKENMAKMVAKETSQEEREALEHYAEDFDRLAQEIAPGLAEEILDNDRQYAFGEAAVKDLAGLQAYYRKHIALYREAQEAYRAETNEQRQYVVTPEQALATQQKKAEAAYRLERLGERLKQSLTQEQGKRIFERFNARAAELEQRPLVWDPQKGMDNLTEVATLGGSMQSAMDQYYDLIFDEIARSAGKIKGAAAELEQLKLPTEWTLEEKSEYPQQEKINVLKESFHKRRQEEREASEKEGKPFAEDELIPEEEVDALLDTVNSHLSQRKDIVENFINAYEDRIHTSAILEYHTMRSMSEYHGKGYGDLLESYTYGGAIAYNTIKPEKAQMVEQILTDPPEISEDVAKNAAAIIHKMEEYGFITGNSGAEQGTKIYGYEKLLIAKQKLQEAVDAGDIEKIAEANEAYEKIHAQVQEIHEMIKKAFPGETFVPGNVDTIRNKGKNAIPVEFAGDYLTDSKFNGLFQVGEYAKRLGVSIEEYLQNPGKCMYESFQKSITEKGVESVTKGHKNFLESFNELMDREEEGLSNHFVRSTTGGEVGLAIGRGLQGVFLLETDPHRREEMMRYQQHVIQLVDVLINNEAQELKFYNDAFTQAGFSRNMEPELVARMKEGLKAAFLEGGPIRKKHMPYVHTDDRGVAIPDPLNYQGLLEKKDQYANLTALYQGVIADAKKCDYSMVKALVQEAMFDYLMAHPEDRERQEYRDLEKLAIDAAKELEISGEDATANVERYRSWKTAIETEHEKLENRELDADEAFRKEYMAKQAKLNKALSKLPSQGRVNVQFVQNEPKEITALREDLKAMIDERIQQLADGYRAREVTESYLLARYEQLTALREDVTMDIRKEKLPEFVSLTDPDQRRLDLQIFNDRVQNRAYEGYLKSLETYITYRLEQEPALERGDLSNEEWQEAYSSAIRTQAAQNRGLTPLPGGAREYLYGSQEPEKSGDIGKEQDDLQNNRQSDRQSNRQSSRQSSRQSDERESHAEFYQEISEHLGAESNGNQRKILGVKQLRSMYVGRLEGKLMENIPDLKDPEQGKITEEKLLTAIAQPLAYDLIESRGGVVPAGMSDVEFVRKLAQDKSFKAVVKPFLEEIYEEWENHNKGRDHEEPREDMAVQAENASAKHLVKLVDNKTILHAFGLETKAVKKGQPGAGVKHAKTLAQTRAEEQNRKAAEDARKQKTDAKVTGANLAEQKGKLSAPKAPGAH